jgi:hypothetical protein
MLLGSAAGLKREPRMCYVLAMSLPITGMEQTSQGYMSLASENSFILMNSNWYTLEVRNMKQSQPFNRCY